MEITRNSCRLCVLENDFNVSLFGNFSRKVNLIDKINICLKIMINKNDKLNTICYKCVENVERYYSFVTYIKKSQTKLEEKQHYMDNTQRQRRIVNSCVPEQNLDADFSFSCIQMSNKEIHSNQMFSYFSPPNTMMKTFAKDPVWKTPKTQNGSEKDLWPVKKAKGLQRPRNQSKDIFESQSQDVDEIETFDWKLTPEDNLIRKIRERHFKDY